MQARSENGRARAGRWIATSAALVGVLLIAACGSGSPGTPLGDGSGAPGLGAAFRVMGAGGVPVVGAVVYLVPPGDIDGAAFDGQDVLDGTSENRDEPLEDAIDRFGAGYPQAVTGVDGVAIFDTIPAGRLFYFVQPAPADTEHVAGGSGCRLAVESTAFVGTTVDVVLSSSPPPTAVHVGTSSCLGCHADYAIQAQHAHRLGFAVPGQLGPLQDTTRYPDFDGGWNLFLPAAVPTGGTPVYFSDFDVGRGFDKFKTSLTDPRPGETLYVIAWFWRNGTDYYVTLENIVTPADPMRTYRVALTYGGAIYKQRMLLEVPGRNGLYPFMQWQSEGDDARFDRTRRVTRDYHLDWYWNNAAGLLQDPPNTKNFEANCTACHSTGFERYQDGGTGEWLTRAVNDPRGAFDIDDDPGADEINVGCEVCHGPGSEHVFWAANSGNVVKARYIITPANLSPSREMMICGRCHDRQAGNGSVVNDEPLNALNQMAPPGLRRSEYLAEYVSRKGPAVGSYWSDLVHSRSHHQQYSDLLKSVKHRNDRYLTTCSDCHESHGYGAFNHHLTADPRAGEQSLCVECHVVDLNAHMLAKTGATHAGLATDCVLCHMPQMAKTGAGRYGLLLGTPTGGAGDADLTYFENDITSHLFATVARKGHPDVSGAQPGSAMPIPYTHNCGQACHNATLLPFLKPGVPPAAGRLLHLEPADED